MLELTEQNFGPEVLQSSDLVLVDFWAPWCNPCKTLMPMLENLEKQYTGGVKFTKASIDDITVAGAYGVRSVPTVMLFRNGSVVQTIVGVKTPAAYAAAIDAQLTPTQ